MSVEEIYNNVKAANPKKYVNLYELPDSIADPLAKITPTEDLFFGTYVCNLLVFDDPFLVGGEFASEYDTTKELLKARFSNFAKYETHVFINLDADGISSNLSGSEDLDAKLIEMCTELAAYGFTYYGKKTESEIANQVYEIVAAFSSGL